MALRVVSWIIDRLDARDDDGMELVQMAIVLLIAMFMGAVLLKAVQIFWPEVVNSVLKGLSDLFG
ncbi:MAG: hypothetical protein QOF60_208 [Actinomycetota bacterium]|jgi:hypothetical protein|nr:hypothetical protein [Actinomycetota bacterium]